MTRCSVTVVSLVALVFTVVAIPTGSAQEGPGAVKAVQLAGLSGVKNDANGRLSVGAGTCILSTGRKLPSLAPIPFKML